MCVCVCVCVYFLKSVRKGHFRNVWVLGGGTFLSIQAAKPARKRALNVSHSLVLNRRLHRLFQAGLGPHLGRHHHAYCWEHIFSAFANPAACLVRCVFLSSNCAAKAAASEADGIWCSLWSHAGYCEPLCIFAVLGVFRRLTRTQVEPPERALLRTKGFCGASGDATARGVNLYPDMVAAC